MCLNYIGLSKTGVLEWCLKYSFELVELNPNDDDQQEAGTKLVLILHSPCSKHCPP